MHVAMMQGLPNYMEDNWGALIGDQTAAPPPGSTMVLSSPKPTNRASWSPVYAAWRHGPTSVWFLVARSRGWTQLSCRCAA